MLKTNFPFTMSLSPDPFDDSHLLVKHTQEKTLLLFDLGQIETLSLKNLLKIKYVFVSHTHMDHFMGFAFFLRSILPTTQETITFFGPEGFIENIACAIRGFTWNLIEDVSPPLFEIYEIHENKLLYVKPTPFLQIKPSNIETLAQEKEFSKVLLKTPQYSVECNIFDHQTPVLGFKIKAPAKIKVDKSKIQKFPQGIWIKEAIQKILTQNEDLTQKIAITQNLSLSLKEIQDTLFQIVPEYSVAYIVDVQYKSNIKTLIPFIKDSDVLFIESCFLKKDCPRASFTYHLCTQETASIIKQANIKKYFLHHFSKRYKGQFTTEDFYSQVKENL